MNRPSCKPWVGTGHPSVMNLHEIPFGETLGAIHSTNIPTGPTGKSGPPQKVDPFFRNFSGWTKPIHWVLDQNFRKFWLNGSRVLVLKQYHHRYQYQSDSVTSLYQLGCHWGKWLQKTLITPWTCNSQVHESAKQTPTFDLLACESIRFFRFRRWPEIRLRGLQAIDLHDIPCIWQTYDANVLHIFPWWLLVWKNQSILTTVKPVLSGHPQGMLKCPLNTGCPPSTGFDI